MLILVTVTVNVAMNGGLFNQAQIVRTQTDKETAREQLTSVLVGALDSSGILTVERVKTSIESIEGTVTGDVFPLTVEYKGEEFIVTENGINNNVSKIIREGEYVAPIPDGYTVSTATGENTIAGGLVIYEGTEPVTDDNVETAKTTRNQFVWIPINNPNDMYGIDANGNKLGKLYNFNAEEAVSNLCWTEENGIMSWTSILSLNYREPANSTTTETWSTETVVNGTTIPAGTSYVYDSQEMFTLYDGGTYTSTMYQTEFNNMINSVIKYKGFYVGRYETGGFNTDKVVVKAGEGNNSINNTNWYKMYRLSKTLSNSSVTSGMIYGCQWDQIMKWAGCSKHRRASNTYITKPSTTGTVYLDGITYDKIQNIYDLAGNVYDVTQEQKETPTSVYRIARGSYYNSSGYVYASTRNESSITYSGSLGGSRLMLYIN